MLPNGQLDVGKSRLFDTSSLVEWSSNFRTAALVLIRQGGWPGAGRISVA